MKRSVPSRQRRVLEVLCFWRKRRPVEAPEIAAARALLRAIDAGGVPLNPARVNAIGRALGLDLPSKAPVEQNIERIRLALARHDANRK